MNKSRTKSFSVLFWGQRTRKNKKGELPIYMRITVDGKRAELTTHRYVEEKFWDAKAQRVKNKCANAQQVNGYLDLLRGKVQEAFNRLLSSEDEITAKMLKSILCGEENKPKPSYKPSITTTSKWNNKH